MRDILQTLFSQYPFSPKDLSRFAIGEKNVAIMLNDGNIGVCSTLCHKFEGTAEVLFNPDFTRYNHRVIVNAWINARVNYSDPVGGNKDIFDTVNFGRYKQVAMVGYFGSLAKKLESIAVTTRVFDLDEHEKPVEPLKNLNLALSTSDAVIITATSISNNTFDKLMDSVSPHAQTFILGPSTPLSPSLFDIHGIVGLFGAQFQEYDNEVLNAISEGGGTRSFLGRMKKVFLLR